MSRKISVICLTLATLANGVLPAQSQPYEFYNDPYEAQMCLPYEGDMCQVSEPYSSQQRQQSSSVNEAVMCKLESPPRSRPQAHNNGERFGLYEIDGEGRMMTQREYEALMFRRRLDGVKTLTNPGGTLGYFISRLFTDDIDQQRHAAELGASGFNVLTSPYDRSHLEVSTVPHASALSRTSGSCQEPARR